jgi:hypothetical protein
MAPSTTQKLTLTVLTLIQRYCVTMNAGVIVRLQGKDVGITAADFQIVAGKLSWVNAPAKFSTLTIPKKTLVAMNSDLQLQWQTVILWDNASTEDKNAIVLNNYRTLHAGWELRELSKR